jgi:hypothetical protein
MGAARMSTLLLDAALDYANRGWPVFPLSREKKPKTSHGFKDASTDQEQVKEWWRDAPYSNIGCPTGITFDVIDIEAANVERFEALCKEHGVNLSDFPRAKSGRGGLHVYVARTGFGCPIPGLGDLKGRGGYALAPPSRLALKLGGGSYEWIKEPNGVFPPCPEFVLQLIASQQRERQPFTVEASGRKFESEPLAPVEQEQRFTADSPCPICGGHKDGTHGPGEGAGVHCWGFVSDDGKYAVCTRAEPAGELELNPNTQGYHHLLVGDCGCGQVHGVAEDEFKPTAGLSSNVQTASLEPNYGLLVLSGPELLAGASHLLDLPFLPLLSIDGYFVKGWSHLVSGYPRVGKTDLLLACCRQWLRMGERVLYITEEPVTIWQHRLKMWSGDWTNLQVAFGLGADPALLRKLAREGAATVVVLDALRNLLRLKDEKDNSEIARVVNPWVADARAVEKTLVLAHHQRKGGGEHGEGISGGHALMGAFDIPIEVLWDPSKGANRRLVRTYPRLIEAKEGLYEKVADGEFEYVGDPQAVALVEVTDTARSLLTDVWQSTDEIWAGLDEPKPSKEQVRKALTDLAKQKAALRDPSIESGPARGKTHRWKRPDAGSSEASATGSELSSNDTVYTLEPNSASAPSGPDPNSEEMKAAEEAERRRKRKTMFK